MSAGKQVLCVQTSRVDDEATLNGRALEADAVLLF